MYAESLAKIRRWLWLGLGLLLVLFALCTCNGVNIIQSDLQTRGQDALKAAGLDASHLSVKGCDVNLDGKVASQEMKDQYSTALASLKGVRPKGYFDSSNGFFNNLTIDKPVKPVKPEITKLRDPYLDVDMNDSKVTISCLLSADEKQKTMAAAQKIYGAENVIDNCSVADDLNEASWLDGTLGLFPKFSADLEGAKLSARQDSLSIAGLAGSDEQKTALAGLADSAVGLNLINNLTVKEKEVELIEPVFSFRKREDKLELYGELDQATSDSVLNALKDQKCAAFVDGQNQIKYSDKSNQIKTSDRVFGLPWAANAFTEACVSSADSPDFSMEYANSKLTLSGTVDSEAKRTAIGEKFSKSLKDVEIDNKIKVVKPVAFKDASFNWRKNDDRVVLRGNVDEQTSGFVTAAAGCAVGADHVDNKLVVSSDYKPLAWAENALLKACDTVQDSPDFALAYSNGVLTLNGTVDSNQKRTSIAESFIKSAENIEVVNKIKVLEPAKLEIPTPSPSPQVAAPITPVEIETNINQAKPETKVKPTDTEATVKPVEVEAKVNPIVNLKPPKLRVDVSTNKVRLLGVLPSPKEQISVAEGFGAKSVENNTTVEEAIDNPDYLAKVIELGPEVAKELDRVTLNLENEKLTILGVAATDEQREAIGDFVQERLEPDVTVVNKLTVKSTLPFIEDGK